MSISSSIFLPTHSPLAMSFSQSISFPEIVFLVDGNCPFQSLAGFRIPFGGVIAPRSEKRLSPRLDHRIGERCVLVEPLALRRNRRGEKPAPQRLDLS